MKVTRYKIPLRIIDAGVGEDERWALEPLNTMAVAGVLFGLGVS